MSTKTAKQNKPPQVAGVEVSGTRETLPEQVESSPAAPYAYGVDPHLDVLIKILETLLAIREQLKTVTDEKMGAVKMVDRLR